MTDDGWAIEITHSEDQGVYSIVATRSGSAETYMETLSDYLVPTYGTPVVEEHEWIESDEDTKTEVRPTNQDAIWYGEDGSELWFRVYGPSEDDQSIQFRLESANLVAADRVIREYWERQERLREKCYAFNIAGVRLWSTSNEVIQELGEPTEVTQIVIPGLGEATQSRYADREGWSPIVTVHDQMIYSVSVSTILSDGDYGRFDIVAASLRKKWGLPSNEESTSVTEWNRPECLTLARAQLTHELKLNSVLGRIVLTLWRYDLRSRSNQEIDRRKSADPIVD